MYSDLKEINIKKQNNLYTDKYKDVNIASKSNSNSIVTVEDIRKEIDSNREDVADLVVNYKSKANSLEYNDNQIITSQNTIEDKQDDDKNLNNENIINNDKQLERFVSNLPTISNEFNQNY